MTDFDQFQALFMEHWLEGAKAVGAYVFGLFTWLLARVFKSNPVQNRELFEATLKALKSPTGCDPSEPNRAVCFEGGYILPDSSWDKLVWLRVDPQSGGTNKASHLFTKKELKALHVASLEAMKQWKIQQRIKQEKAAMTYLQGKAENPGVPVYSATQWSGPAMVVSSMSDNGQALSKR